jgi:hypothetical protein
VGKADRSPEMPQDCCKISGSTRTSPGATPESQNGGVLSDFEQLVGKKRK